MTAGGTLGSNPIPFFYQYTKCNMTIPSAVRPSSLSGLMLSLYLSL
jgi:hypothetical protein